MFKIFVYLRINSLACLEIIDKIEIHSDTKNL